MNMLAKIDSVPEAIVGVIVAGLPLLFIGVFFLWISRLVTTLRERLDAIEDKLELVLLHLESTHKSDGSKKEKPE